MRSKTANKFSTEVRERAIRLVLDHEGDHGSRWSTVVSIASKIGCTAHASEMRTIRAGIPEGGDICFDCFGYSS